MSPEVSKHAKPIGVTPAIALVNPKHAHNVGAAIRAASCFGIHQVFFSGDRVSLDTAKGERLPREERMKGYQDVELIQYNYFFDAFADDTIPVAVEVSPTAEVITYFEHPDNALYVFGPEDGSLYEPILGHCHRHIVIPTRHCVNLSAAVYLTLYDRQQKSYLSGAQTVPAAKDILHETRGWEEYDYDFTL